MTDCTIVIKWLKLLFLPSLADCWNASGRPDSTGDPLRDAAGVCHPTAEGDAADASGQGKLGVFAEGGL